MLVRHGLLPRHGRLYVCAVIAIGAAIIVDSVHTVVAHHLTPQWLTLAALTLLSGSATVRLPSVPATISISETFVFTSVLLFGAEAGATIVALDGLIISAWFATKKREPYRIAFNMAAPATSIWAAAQVYFSFPGIEPLVSSSGVSIDQLVIPLLAFTVSHFFLNSWLIALAVHFETSRKTLDIWRRDFLWLSLNYFGGASVSALLVVYTRDINVAYLGIIVPLLLILYFTFRIPMARVEDANRHLKKLNTLHLSTIETLAHAIDAKDQVTHGHIRRVQLFAVELARNLGISDPDQLKAIEASALLHDMGKLAVPEHILNKPGRLTPAEFDKMKLHASIGADILSSIEFPYPVVPIVRHHHENWDGSGYPEGLAGVDIPIGARILSVVDCFDALTSDRPYRPRMSTADALDILRARRGSMYDPLIVDAFIALQPKLSIEEKPSTTSTAVAEQRASVESPEAFNGRPRLDAIDAYRLQEVLLLSRRRPWSDVADLVMTRIASAARATACAIYIHDETSDELVLHSAVGSAQALRIGARMRVGEGVAGWAAAQKRPVLNGHAAIELSALGEASAELRTVLAVPVFASERVCGVLCVYRDTQDGFSSEHQTLLHSVAQQLADHLSDGDCVGRAAYPSPRHFNEYVRVRLDSDGSPFRVLLLYHRDGECDAASIAVALDVMDLLFTDTRVAIVVPAEQTAEGILSRTRVLRSVVSPGGVVTSLVVPTNGTSFEDLLDAVVMPSMSSSLGARPIAYRPRRTG